jgi:hypothetical protein
MSASTAARPALYGVMGEFDNRFDLLEAVKKARAEGYTRMDAYTPFPIHGLAEALGFQDRRLPWLVLAGGVFGCVLGFGSMYWIAAIRYPINVGGRPLFSWPSFLPITFETTVLFAALAAVFGMLALNGLPRPYHPVFNAPRFALASRNRFFFCIESADPKFDPGQVRQLFEQWNARGVIDLEN